MLYNITKYLAIEDVSTVEPSDEAQNIIVDISELTEEADTKTILNCFNKTLALASIGKKCNAVVILKHPTDPSMAGLMATAIFVFANNMEWNKAIKIIKNEYKKFNPNEKILSILKEEFEKNGL